MAELRGEKRRLEQQLTGASGARDERERREREARERKAREEEREREAERDREEAREREAERDRAASSDVSSGASRRLPSVRDPPPRAGAPPSEADGLGEGDDSERKTHEDGRTERCFPDGRRVVRFANGTLKDVEPSADGPVSTVHFTNGDVKRTHPGGRVEYFYREVDTWHTTHPGGTEVYHFPSGQTEAHGPNGYKEILFPDGLLRRVYPDGREEDELAR